ncbi:MAG: SurA N-terminal domain-containing protein [Clostridia bacterium]|nr:SurA N-terminal domain-containing protein [Clostridia bacterium]
MNKKSLLALLLSCMLLLSSCSLIVKDPVVDAATEIIKVGDKVFTKAEVNQSVDAYLQQLQNYYTQNYGYSIDITSESTLEQARDEVINTLVEDTVVAQKAAELGVDQLTEEEESELNEQWTSYYSLIRSVFFPSEEEPESTEPENEEAAEETQAAEGEAAETAEEAPETAEGENAEPAEEAPAATEKPVDEATDAQIRAYIYNYFGVTEQSMRTEKVNEKLKAEVVKAVTVSDEEVQTRFDELVAEAKTTYESDLSEYGSAVNGSKTIYYRPAGYRMVKQILLQFNSEDQEIIDQISSKMTNENSTVTSLTSTLSGVENLDELLSQVSVNVGELVIDRGAAADAAETVTDAVEEVAENAAEAVGDAAETVADAVEEVAENAADAVTEVAENAAEAVEEVAEEAAETVAETVEQAGITVRDLSVAVSDSLSEELDADTRENIRLLAAARARLEVYENALTEATEAAYAHLDVEAAEVMDKIAAGEDWDTLVAQYNDDPGMTAGRATAETGYAVCEGFEDFDASFTQAAMALQNIGDVSEPTRGSSNGYYIIKYVADVEEGPVDLATVSEGIHSELLTTKQDEYYTQQVAQWVEDAHAVIDRKSLKD